MEHVLRQCRIALRIAELCGLDDQVRSAIYYSALLVNVGCHADAHEQAHWFGDDIALKATKYAASPSASPTSSPCCGCSAAAHPVAPAAGRRRLRVCGPARGRRHDHRHARLARSLGEELGLDEEVLAALAASYERWDGRGYPGELRGRAHPGRVADRAARRVPRGRPPERWRRGRGRIARRRSGIPVRPGAGRGRAPRTPGRCSTASTRLDSWDAVLDGEPGLARTLSAGRVRRPRWPPSPASSTSSRRRCWATPRPRRPGRARGRRARACPQDEPRVAAPSRAGHRLRAARRLQRHLGQARAAHRGRVGAGPPPPAPHRADAAPLAGARPARPDRRAACASGWTVPATRRGLDRHGHRRPGRVLATADAYQAMREPRPHRAAS